MTAIRSFPDAPLAKRSLGSRIPAWAGGLWHALNGIGQRRAAVELASLADRYVQSKPALARQLRAIAAQCRSGETPAPIERSPS